MRTEPTHAQRIVTGILGLAFAGGLGLWLMMSYFGIWTSDAKVSVQVDEVGDAIGPGAKVRYHGIIVGRVLKLVEDDGSYRLEMLVDGDHAESIPNDATARILPGTIFGSEYVELLSDRDADGDNHLASGDVLQADSSDSTLRLMESFDSAERLISTLDAEDLNRITNKLAPALDGHGDDIKSFLERADRVITDVNADLPTTWQTLQLAPAALDTLTDITPDLVSAAEHAQLTSDTIVTYGKVLGQVLTDSTRTVERGETLLDKNHDVIVPFVARLDRLTNLVADNSTSLQDVLTNFAAVGHNGANGIDDNAIQMIGTIGTDLVDAYTPADCARYGPTLIATNCGDPVPAPEPSSADRAAEASALADRFNDLLLGGSPDAPAVARATATTGPSDPARTAQSTPLSGLLSILGLGGAR